MDALNVILCTGRFDRDLIRKLRKPITQKFTTSVVGAESVVRN
jgi:hypothetical protein